MLGPCLKDANCYGDICPGNICPADICPKFLDQKFYWIKNNFQTQIFFEPKNFSDLTFFSDPKLFWTQNFFKRFFQIQKKIFLDPKFYFQTFFPDPQFILAPIFFFLNFFKLQIFQTKISVGSKIFRPEILLVQNKLRTKNFLTQNFSDHKFFFRNFLLGQNFF